MIRITLKDFLLYCKTCAASKDLYSVDRFVLCWKMRSAMDDLYSTESFGYDDLLSIGFLMSARCAYSKKYSTIFCTNLWTDFFLIWKYQEDIFLALLQKLIITRYFWSFWRKPFNNFLNKSSLLHFLTFPSFGKVKGKGNISPDQWMEKLKMRNLSWSINGLEVLNWLMSEYRKTIVAEFFFSKHIHQF